MVEQNRGLSLITGGKCEGSVKRQIRFIPGRLEVIAGARKVVKMEIPVPRAESAFSCTYRECLFFRGATIAMGNSSEIEIDRREREILQDNCGKRHLR